jgi:O-acetyl-ADP-ribose deacetylase (regulator of RNase III)
MSRVLKLQDYHSLINLQPKSFKSDDKKINYAAIVRQVVEYFSRSSNSLSHRSIEEQRAFIRQILTTRDPIPDHHYPPQIYDLIDQILAYERDHMKSLTSAIHLPIQFKSLPYIRVWRGDITTLIVDAIVNAANSGLLGCFQPTHLCIDNVIHAAAGPRLRDDCYTIMEKQRESEPVGHAKVTIAHNLPSKYVLHTVGPELYHGARVTEKDARELASCYEACLNLAAEMKTITSIAFCCISTGLFAFPADYACRIAIETVITWFRQQGSTTNVSLIVFDVFSLEDEHRYFETLDKFNK